MAKGKQITMDIFDQQVEEREQQQRATENKALNKPEIQQQGMKRTTLTLSITFAHKKKLQEYAAAHGRTAANVIQSMIDELPEE